MNQPQARISAWQAVCAGILGTLAWMALYGLIYWVSPRVGFRLDSEHKLTEIVISIWEGISHAIVPGLMLFALTLVRRRLWMAAAASGVLALATTLFILGFIVSIIDRGKDMSGGLSLLAFLCLVIVCATWTSWHVVRKPDPGYQRDRR